MPLQIRTSHRLETLLDALAADLAAAPLPPLVPETIVVPGQGIARWLQLGLATRHGIAASLELPFPGAFVQRLCAAAAPGEPDRFEPAVLALRIFRLLADARLQAKLDKAAQYCADDADQQKRWQLSQRLAACFDDYQLYRDDLLLAFAQAGPLPRLPHARWQAFLWRELLRDAGAGDAGPAAAGPLFGGGDAGAPPTAQRLQRLRQLLGDADAARALLPPRLSVFGSNSLPPAFLDLLVAIGDLLPVRLYLQRPSEHFFGDQDRRGGGHPLLAACGQPVRTLFDLLTDRDLSSPEDALPTPPPDGDGLLATLQRDLLQLQARGRPGAPPPLPLAADDDSLRLHDCHSALREMQVLRDQLLAAFARDDRLQPHDVLVLVPDIDGYAPFIHAVFDPLADTLPFHVADKSPASALPLAATVLELLRLGQDRVDAPSVLRLLEDPSLRRAFALAPQDLPVLRAWLSRTRIAWGIDAAHRKRAFDLPAFAENSWHEGLQRLLLGHATGPLEALCLGLLPAADGTAARGELLARFCDFTEALFGWLKALGRPHALPVWADLIDQLGEQMFVPADAEAVQGQQALRTATARLRQQAELAALREELSPPVFAAMLAQALERLAGRGGFLTGAVTFAALQPLRLVPVPVLAIAGLADGAFPRRQAPAAFDLIATAPRRGDPDRRAGDRQLFLDALQAARQQLILLWTGHSQKDDSERAPSVVLAELLDHLEQAFLPPPGAASVRAHVVVRHPLQAFSPRYRDGADARLFTHAVAAAAAPLPAPAADAEPADADADVLLLADLLAFWRHPAKFYCQRVLQLQLASADDRDDDTEPFAVHGLDDYQLQDEAVRCWLDGRPAPTAAELLAARGWLPPGAGGAVDGARIDFEARLLLATVQRHAGGRSVGVDLQVGGRRLLGSIEQVTAEALVAFRPATIKHKDRLRGWILHACLNALRAAGADVPVQTLLLGKGPSEQLQPMVGDASLRLADLVCGYELGLQAPLPFFEHASPEYAGLLADGHEPAEAIRRVRDKWLQDSDAGGRWRPGGDGVDPWVALCFADREPLGAAFEQWAQRIWTPLLTMCCEAEAGR